jgi:hypothetical protein
MRPHVVIGMIFTGGEKKKKLATKMRRSADYKEIRSCLEFNVVNPHWGLDYGGMSEKMKKCLKFIEVLCRLKVGNR